MKANQSRKTMIFSLQQPGLEECRAKGNVHDKEPLYDLKGLPRLVECSTFWEEWFVGGDALCDLAVSLGVLAPRITN